MSSRRILSVFRSKAWWFVIPVAGIGIAAAIFPYWRPSYWTTRSELAATKTSIRAQGEPLTFRDLQVRDESGYLIGDEAEKLLARLGETEWALREVVRSSPPVSPENLELLRNELNGSTQSRGN